MPVSFYTAAIKSLKTFVTFRYEDSYCNKGTTVQEPRIFLVIFRLLLVYTERLNPHGASAHGSRTQYPMLRLG